MLSLPTVISVRRHDQRVAVGLPPKLWITATLSGTAKVGDELRKGDELEYLQFGGSGIGIVFQDRNIVLEAEVGAKYLQGERIGQSEGH